MNDTELPPFLNTRYNNALSVFFYTNILDGFDALKYFMNSMFFLLTSHDQPGELGCHVSKGLYHLSLKDIFFLQILRKSLKNIELANLKASLNLLPTCVEISDPSKDNDVVKFKKTKLMTTRKGFLVLISPLLLM